MVRQITSVTLIAFCVGASVARAQGSIAGRVVSAETTTPIAGAEVSIHGQARSVTTDSIGKFSLRDLKAGNVFLITRAVGFRPDSASVELFDDVSVSRDVILKASSTTLGEVVVRDSATPLVSAKLREFDERRRASAGGKFLDSTVISRWESRKTGDLLSTVSGVDVQRQRSAAFVLGSRATASPFRVSARPVPCFMDVYLDGAPVAVANTSFDVNSIGLNHIVAIEVYSGPANTPAKYNRTSGGCGVVLIWTR